MKHKPLFALRWCGWAVLFVLTLEVCARTEDKLLHGAPFFGNYSRDGLYQMDALGKYGKPHSSYMKWHLNAEGYRGPELRSGTYRIACLGSSETFGLYESPEMEWPRLLELKLNAGLSGRPYEVVNVAYPGLSLGTGLVRLEQMVGAVQPQMVVIYPSYTSYIEKGTAETWPPAAVKPQAPRPLVRGFHWRIGEKVAVMLKDVLPERMQDWMRAWQVRHDKEAHGAMATLPEANVEAFNTDLNTLLTQLQARGIRVVLVTHANRFGKTVEPSERGFLTLWRKFYPMLQEGGFLDMEQRMSDVVREEGAEHHVPTVDAANEIAPGPKNFAEFAHFTDAGSERLASLVAAEVESERAGGP